jgi:phage terminase large subunit
LAVRLRTHLLFDTLEGAKRWVITADSARPETISHMRRRLPEDPVGKEGKGSVEEGIAFLQSYDIVVHPRCQHTIDELTLYRYKTDR